MHLTHAACADVPADLVGSESVPVGKRHMQEWITGYSEVIPRKPQGVL
jgi:hypothetical protein